MSDYQNDAAAVDSLANERPLNDQWQNPSEQHVYNLVDMLRQRISSYSPRGQYEGIEQTVGMCENRPNNKKDVAYKITQRAVASLPTATVIFQCDTEFIFSNIFPFNIPIILYYLCNIAGI